MTLTEILVVIVVIASLAAIVAYSMGSMKLSAAKAQSANNLRQLAAGIVSYAGDNQGNLPPSTVNYLMFSNFSSTGQAQGWAAVMEYLGGERPAQQSDLQRNRLPALYVNIKTSKQYTDPNPAVSDYTLWTNARILNGGALDYLVPKRLSDLSGSPNALPLATDNACSVGITFKNPKNGAVVGMNAAFADGSVRWYRGNDAGNGSEVSFVTAGYAGIRYAIPKLR